MVHERHDREAMVGGGGYLVNTFNAVAAWSGCGGYRSLLRIVMVMGLIYSLLVVAFTLNFRVWMNWFLQSTLIYLCLMVPTIDIKVTNRVNPSQASATVANVPLGLGTRSRLSTEGGSRGRVERHLFALSGGGYRGMFSTTVLRRLEENSGVPLAGRFDMLAGTSIGGILAIGLACGIPAQDLAEFMREHGPTIFKPRALSFGGLSSARYGKEGFAKAITTVLTKPITKRHFLDIPAALIVCAVDEMTSPPRLFKTRMAGGDDRDAVSTIDVALATSAAPTYFPPHAIDGRKHVDGGLIANAPDAVLLAG